MYVDVSIPAGQYANGTHRQARGRYVAGDHVRTPNGPNLQPIGGYVQKGTQSLTGVARAITNWADNSGVLYIAAGTEQKLYVQTASGSLYDITPAGFTSGRVDAAAAGGFGSGTFGSGPFGTARPDSQNILPASAWTLDTFGQYLVGCMAEDGKLYEWTLNTANPALQISGSPSNCTGLSVSQERFIYAYKGRNVSWCDQGNETDWTPTALNQAGDIDLDTYGVFQCGRKVTGAHLHFSTVDVWRSSYQGLPVVYGFEKIGNDCGIISKGSPVVFDNRCMWMGRQAFYMCDGVVQPVPCDVADAVFGNLNYTQSSKVAGFHNPTFGEVWWYYPSAASTECDRYVFYNYRYGHWWTGTLRRTAGCSPGVFQYPLCVSVPAPVALSVITLTDANGQAWSVGVDASGALTTVATASAGVASGLISDGAGGYWSVTVDTSGALTATSTGVSPGIPNAYILFDGVDYWSVTISSAGALSTAFIGTTLTTSSSCSIYQHEVGHTWDVTPYARTAPLNEMLGIDKRLLLQGFISDEENEGDSEVTFYGRDFPNSVEITSGPYTITTEPTDMTFNTRFLEMEVQFVTPNDSRAGIFSLDVKPISAR